MDNEQQSSGAAVEVGEQGDNHPDIRAEDTFCATRGEPSRQVKFAGKLIILLTVVSFLFVGTIINLLQVLLLVSFTLGASWEKWRRCHKRINSCLVYALFSPPICLLYYWSSVSLRIQLDDVQALMEIAGRKSGVLAIVLPNHSYELDYMISFVLADQLGGVGSYKSMSKEELRYLPVIGWAMWMSDIIFVKRDWKRDRHIIGRKLDALFDYDQTILGIFAEGTRFTEEKHRLSAEFARSRQMEPLKYHLVPRARGFNYSVRHYLREIRRRSQVAGTERDHFKLLNLQIVMPDEPKFRDFIEGRQLRADVYCEEVKLSPEIVAEVLDSPDEDHCPKLSRLLMAIYRRKDQLMDEYRRTGRFPANPKTGGLFPYRRGRLTLAIWLAGFLLTYGSLGYLAVSYLARSVLFWTLLASFVVACMQMLKRIARESKVPRSKSSPPVLEGTRSPSQPEAAMRQKLV